MYYKGGVFMSTISLRIDKKDKETIENYAKVKGISISQLVRDSVFEKIEDEIDLELYSQAMQEYKSNPEEAVSFDEAVKELGLNE